MPDILAALTTATSGQQAAVGVAIALLLSLVTLPPFTAMLGEYDPRRINGKTKESGRQSRVMEVQSDHTEAE